MEKMKSRVLCCASAAAVATFATVTPAHAAIVTATFDIAALYNGNPIDAVFKVAIDPNIGIVSDVTSGVSLLSTNLPYDPSSIPAIALYDSSGQSLSLATLDTALTKVSSPGFFVTIDNAFGANPTSGFWEIRDANGNNTFADDGTITVTSELSATPTPEPEGWALAIVGFGLVGAAMRRRSVARMRLAYA